MTDENGMVEMAVCTFCQRDMTTAAGCGARVMRLNQEGKVRPPIPYGYELRYALHSGHDYAGPPDTCTPEARILRYRTECQEKPCHDCGAVYGEYHHPGCDWEECPWCLWQVLSCGCHGPTLGNS